MSEDNSFKSEGCSYLASKIIRINGTNSKAVASLLKKYTNTTIPAGSKDYHGKLFALLNGLDIEDLMKFKKEYDIWFS